MYMKIVILVLIILNVFLFHLILSNNESFQNPLEECSKGSTTDTSSDINPKDPECVFKCINKYTYTDNNKTAGDSDKTIGDFRDDKEMSEFYIDNCDVCIRNFYPSLQIIMESECPAPA